MVRSAFGSHPRTLTLINVFSEGINLCSADVDVNTEMQASNGFELVKQLHAIHLPSVPARHAHSFSWTKSFDYFVPPALHEISASC